MLPASVTLNNISTCPTGLINIVSYPTSYIAVNPAITSGYCDGHSVAAEEFSADSTCCWKDEAEMDEEGLSRRVVMFT